MAAGSRNPRGSRAALAALAAIFAVLLFTSAYEGPDFQRYYQWARAFRSGDILQIHGDVLSPLGVPLTQWSFGPGLVFSLVSSASARPETAAFLCLVAGWLWVLLFWLAMIRILDRVTNGNRPLGLVGLGMAFVGTHLGFYSIAVSSETFSYACLALLYSWTLAPRGRLGWMDALVTGVLAAFLIIVRPQMGMYAAPVLAILLPDFLKKRPGTREGFVSLCLMLTPIAIALLEVGLANRWMTGSLLRSPYAFGSASFKSVDLARPELWAVLAHPWHGLLVYHPLYVVLFLVALRMVFEKRPVPEKLFLGLTVLVVALHYFLQSAWYAWWLGIGTFGMRALGICAVLLVPAFCRHLAERVEREKPVMPLVGLALAASGWSFLLFLQGDTNFYTYGELLAAQKQALLEFCSRTDFLASVGIVATVCIVLRLGRSGDPSSRFTLPSVLLWTMALFCLTSFAGVHCEAAKKIGPSTRLALVSALAALVTLALHMAARRPAAPGRANRRLEYPLGYALLGIFVLSSLVFGRLAVRTEIRVVGKPHARAGFRYEGTIHFEELELTYEEYLRVPGFAAKKRALRQFLDASEQEAGDQARERPGS